MNENLLSAMEKRLTPEYEKMLKNIYAPKEVLIPPQDARRTLSVLPDGRIRAYGIDTDEYGKKRWVYYESENCGLSWQIHYDDTVLQEFTYIPEKGRYITAKSWEKGYNDGLYVFYSDKGPDDPEPHVQKIWDVPVVDIFQFQKSRYSDRIFFTAQHMGENDFYPDIFYSDDFGETFSHVTLPLQPKQELVYPHKGYRWRYFTGSEPVLCELSRDTLMLLIRNSTDCFFACCSHDGGLTWSDYEKTGFYGTATSAFLLPLSDGRILSLWNNTKPLPEVNHYRQDGLTDENKLGVWEDAFTNRDAAHAAVSDDGGKSWKGYREIFLNPIRNNADFRYAGGRFAKGDKSIHQFQAIELPYGKVLIALGQNAISRRFLIMDLAYLYETSRKEDFIDGLNGVSSHMYLKSYNGASGAEPNGHCQWNRFPGAVMMPDPTWDGKIGTPHREVVLIRKTDDDRLRTSIGGITWNFPMSRKGKVSAEILLTEKSLRFTLSDRWFNSCDKYAGSLSPFTFEVDTDDIASEFVTVTIRYDVDARRAEVYADEKFLFFVDGTREVPTGISYLILQCVTDGDSKGAYIRELRAERID